MSRKTGAIHFESCAATYGQRVIGVVLSGGSHDGAAGLKRIEAAGGIGIVQHPEEAVDPSMPTHAMQSAHSAYCSTIDEMAPLFISLTSGSPDPEAASRAKGTDRAGAIDASDRGQVAADPSSAMSRLRLKPRSWLQQLLG